MDAAWTRLPGPAGFADRVADTLRDGTSVVLRTPDKGADGLERAVASRMAEFSWRTARVDEDASRLPVVRCFTALDLTPPASAASAARDLARAPDFHGVVLQARCTGRDDAIAWSRFLADYERVARAQPMHERGVLVVRFEGALASASPKPDAALAVLDWTGVVTPFDILMHAESALRDRLSNPVRRRLLAECVARIAAFDLAVADRLIELPEASIMNPLETLQAYAEERGWSAARPSSWQDGSADGEGARGKSHSAWLVLDPVRRVEVDRRVWSAQSSVLLPLIEELRIELLPKCRSHLRFPIETTYGRIDRIEDLEIGPLANRIKYSGANPSLAAKLRRLAEMRNALAHLRPLSWRDLVEPEPVL